YGALSGVPARNRSKAGLMGQTCTSKESSRDFALWKTTPGNGCGWESPWGRGRPGWHIECVAMSQALLGNPFDIHGGGCDLVFPHHENELAISRSLAGSELARYWMHHGLVTAGGRKISKSDGFPVRIRDLCRRYHPGAVRLFLLSTHYRRPLDFSHHHLSAAVSALERMYIFLNRCGDLSGEDVRESSFRERPFSEQFCRDVDNDFNIPAGISQIFTCMRRMNRLMDEAGGFRGLDDGDKVRISEMVILCRDVLGILGDSG
ncbi:MAG TPA: cysteine--tRNA ligase, partial [Deltaproteobacteria bacterium]|nr:cysteine--tRNA ligase [Deltaproteobacteria bacterium]